MSIRKTITVTLATHGEVDQPCTAACPDLALSTDGPTVAAALHALAKAIEYLPVGEVLPPVNEAATVAPPAPPAPVAPDLPMLTPSGARRRRVNGHSAPVARAS
jgi:hypothetical protein